MSLPIFQRTIVDSSGNIQPGASVAVRNETTGDLVTIYADREGGTAKANPFIADSEGFATFYVEPGEYQVTATTPAGTITWSHVAIGDTALLQLAQPTGDTLVGSDDGASGSLWSTVAGFIARLRSSAGASVVGFVQAGAGAVQRTLQDKGYEGVSVKDFGAAGDGVLDDGTAMRLLDAALTGAGGTVRVPRATYVIGAQNSYGVRVTNPMAIKGDGGVYTAINPALASATDDTINVSPSTLTDFTNVIFSGFALHNPVNGSRTGKAGIFIDTQAAGSNAALFKLRDLVIGQGSDYGVYHQNLQASNANGGMYGAIIEASAIKGGVKLDVSGDSISLAKNIISGENIGVNASLVAGASLLEIQANNITNKGGAIRLKSGSRFRILGNNIENYDAGAAAQNNAAIVNVSGENGTMFGGVIQQNLVSAFGASNATTLLRVRNSSGTLIQDNVFLNGGSATVGIDIGADCQNIRIGANTFNGAVSTRVIDAGIGTMGVVKTASLQNGWVAFGAGQATLKFIKTTDGMVTMYGAIKDGDRVNGTLIATLPVGFRPSEILRLGVFVINAGTPQPAQITIEADGSVRLNFAQASDQLNINVVFPADGLANAVSAE